MSKKPTVTINADAASTVTETPSQTIIRSANKTATVKDALGRVITIRRIMPSLRLRLRAIAGPELSKNEQWLGEAVLTFAVVAIKGDPVTPNNLREIEVLADQLDEAGLEAVAVGYVANFGTAVEVGALDTAKN